MPSSDFVNVLSKIAILGCLGASLSSTARGAVPTTRAAIQAFVRSTTAIEAPISTADQEQSNPEVARWISENRESLQGTRPGPFDPTQEYVSTYSGENIFVHVLDWRGKNNLFLPAIIDRPILKASLFQGIEIRVDQYPWGTLVVVPEEQRPNDIDTIVVLTMMRPVDLAEPRIIEGDSSSGIMLGGDTAKLNGGLKYTASPDWIEKWTALDESASWKVRIGVAGDYSLSMTYSCPPGCGGAQVEIVSGHSKVAGMLRETTGVFGDWLNFEKRRLEATLHLNAGVNEITLRPTAKAGTDEILRLYALYLLGKKEQAGLGASSVRARRLRAPTEWLERAKYGVMVHWIAATMPRSGAQLAFCDAVQKFDTERFADTIKETGAAYLIFTLAHGIQKFPVPLKSVDAVVPGRTCSRDLPAELADALLKRGIKLILYYHHGVGDPEWSKASGFLNKDKSAFFAHEAAILTEVGQRYGRKLAGWWFDDRYPLQPFEQLDHAAKVANPERLVAFNSWVLPRSTDFQDYWAGELGGTLFRLPVEGFFDHGGPQDGLQPHALIFLDDPWMHGYLDTEIHAPLFTNDALAQYIEDCNSKSAVVTMNIGIYQDGTMSQPTVNQLVAVRKTIRGK